ncbi:MAG: LysR family transcriptional regulator [Actinomycetia bacterium]|nr:LysR family transcriptional regulator [Actinomycetes bacterium]
MELLLDTRSLMVLRELEAHGSIAGAAHSLQISPAAASQRLSRLSARIGTDLTVSDGRGIRLTPAGGRLAAHAVRVCRQLELAERELGVEQPPFTPTPVSVATFATAAEHLLPEVIDRLGPGFAISLAELPPDQAIPGVISGEHDLAIIRTHEPTTFTRPATTTAKLIATEPLDIVAPPSAGADEVTLSSLSEAAWISGPLGSTLAAAIESTCRTIGGFTPRVVHRVSDAAVVIALAERRLGVGLLPRLATQSAPAHLIHPAPGAVTRSIIAVTQPDSLEYRPVREVWDALDTLDCLGASTAVCDEIGVHPAGDRDERGPRP